LVFSCGDSVPCFSDPLVALVSLDIGDLFLGPRIVFRGQYLGRDIVPPSRSVRNLAARNDPNRTFAVLLPITSRSNKPCVSACRFVVVVGTKAFKSFVMISCQSS